MISSFLRPLSSKVRHRLDFLLQSQFWSFEKINEFQWEKLKLLLDYAFNNVPYYRSIFATLGATPEDIKAPDDFAQLPVLNKKTIQDSFDSLISQGVERSNLSLNSTGGSTGIPLNFYQDRQYEEWADAARLRAWRYIPGYNKKTLEAVFWGAFRDIGKNTSLLQMAHNILREGTLPLNTFDLDEKKLRSYLQLYNLLRPQLLRGYATSLYYVADFIEKTGMKIHQPGAIVSTTEVLHSRVRSKVEQVFGCKVFDSYGCREVSQIATECTMHDGLHIAWENQYVEVKDQNIIVTNLNNYAMPFIRYEVGDLATALIVEPCACGRFSPRLINLIGRDNDNIQLPNGKVINGEFFEFLFFGMPEVIQYQVVYHRKEGVMKMKLHVRSGGVDPSRSIREVMMAKYHFGNIEFIYTDTFDKTPTGKLRFVYMIE